MAKDSTAVTKLIELSQQKAVDVDLDGLFDEPRAKAPLPPPRRSATMPAMQPTAAPPPLPRTRVPSGTQSGLTAVAATDGSTEAPLASPPTTAADELFDTRAPAPTASSPAIAPPTASPADDLFDAPRPTAPMPAFPLSEAERRSLAIHLLANARAAATR